jgi:phenylacetate-CoA ligase
MAVYHRANAQKELIEFVRNSSPFYRDAWKDLPTPTPARIDSLPLTDVGAYWAANVQSPPQTFTGPFLDGTVMRSGGSTGSPKNVYLTRSEQKAVAMVQAVAMAQGCGLVPGDRIAHMSHFGGLYGTFVFFTLALMEMPQSLVHLPIGGNENTESAVKNMFEFGATVLMSNPSTARKIADALIKEGKTMDSLRLIWYTGESVTKGLKSLFVKAFPNASLYPSVYGCVELGPVAIPPYPYQGGDDDVNPKYKVLAPLAVIEILDEDNQPIQQNGKRGTIVVSHLVKRQQPMLRYPTGDIASWTDFSHEIFTLHGRDAVSLKICNAHLPVAFLRESIEESLGEGVSQGSQFVARRKGDAQELTFRIVAEKPSNAQEVCDKVNAQLCNFNSNWRDSQRNGYISPLQVEYITVDQLQLKSSGKVSDIVEERFLDE